MSETYGGQRDRLISQLIAAAKSDERILALWLQGSLADGTGHEYSDVDAYLAVSDDSFDELSRERSQIAGSLGRLLVEMDSPFLQAGHYLFEGLQKLDLFLERASEVGRRERPAVKILFDRDEIGSRLKVGSSGQLDKARRRVEITFLGTLQGAAWPLRLVGRDQWTTLALAELLVINDSIALLMAAQLDPAYCLRNRFSLPRLLGTEQQAKLDSLADGVLAAATARDSKAALAAFLAIQDSLLEEGRLAYTALDMTYPFDPETESAIRESSLSRWPA